MKIVVNDQYTYDTRGLVVAIGDTVILPPGATDNEWKGEVTALTSSYRGAVKSIVGIMIGTKEVRMSDPNRSKRQKAEQDYRQAQATADRLKAVWEKLKR